MAVVAEEEGEAADVLLWNKQKQERPQPAAEEGEQGVNPLEPRFSEYDPKQGEFVYMHYFFGLKFDLDIESPVGPMSHTDKIFKEGFLLSNSVNLVSVKIVSSDYGYPLIVYGTIIARDNLNRKCIYIFQRGKDNCQFISSKDDSLILSGPKRGFMVCNATFFEIDLKVEDARGRKVKDERLRPRLGQLQLPASRQI